jgi:hypothetical protein
MLFSGGSLALVALEMAGAPATTRAATAGATIARLNLLLIAKSLNVGADCN